MTWTARHISRSIDRDPADVAAFAGDPANLPQWAAGLSTGIRRDGDRWLAESPMGDVEVSFPGPVEFGILDHDVTLPDGTRFHNPLRVLRNDRGSEVVFTLYRMPGVSDEDYEADAARIEGDLDELAAILEE
ncbi:hypothetical protein BKA24_003050 [Microbacterium marinum]|jgi:hypothetical protein|uniref:Polyketide cyclase / dehydrase and lipid transport n=1 Tax=Microbacterium marinum TaxID=421115 RepID=A0A7W7BV25_9MICO|nr:SRPBCC family protein [Microbacterium marinum]MBB4668341.1 hypothetical protein [Microbacterium marinum]